MPSPLENWFREIPPITRIYVSTAVLTSIAVQLGFIHPLHLWLNYDRIIQNFQWWRLVTNFFYFGPLSIDFGFHVFFLARYSRMMEEGFFRNKPADYVWLMVFSASLLIILSIIVPYANLPFMGSALSFTMVYIWARRNPYVRLNFLGLVIFTAPYLPWVLLLCSLCLGGQVPVGDILGILVGHIYYFFEDVWPHDPLSNGKKWLATPRIVRWLIEGNHPRDDSIEITDDTNNEEEYQNNIEEHQEEHEPLLEEITESEQNDTTIQDELSNHSEERPGGYTSSSSSSWINADEEDNSASTYTQSSKPFTSAATTTESSASP